MGCEISHYSYLYVFSVYVVNLCIISKYLFLGSVTYFVFVGPWARGLFPGTLGLMGLRRHAADPNIGKTCIELFHETQTVRILAAFQDFKIL